jgi:putative hemolysin
LTEFVVIILLVLVNGVFAGAEIAIVALRKNRIEELAEEGRGSALAVLSLRRNPERFLATVQVGITVVGAAAAAFGGSTIAARIESWLARFAFLEGHAEGTSLALVVAGISYLSIVVGELVPKSLALRSAERYALWVGRPLLALSFVARPIVWLLSSSANLLLRPFGDNTTFTETRHSAEELLEIVEEASAAGTIAPEAGEIASRALELPDLTAFDVMVPRQNVVMVSRRTDREELRRVLLEHKFSRLPVYDGTVDNVLGYITVKDVLALAWEHELVVLEDLIRPPYFVPETKRVVELMNEMRAQHLPFAIVVDEHGGMSGIVTMEDVVEELVGEIFSEHERHPTESISKQADGSVLVSGTTPIREVNRALDIELPEEGDFNTIAGLCLSLAGRVPVVGQSFDLPDGISLKIIDASPRRIRTVRVVIHAAAKALDAGLT